MVARTPETPAEAHASSSNTDRERKPLHQRPEQPEFWDHRFSQGITPWDAGRVPNSFDRFVSASPSPLRTLIPGCGSAWEALHLDRLGWPACALDFAPAALAAAQQVFAKAGGYGGELVLADFFTFAPPERFELVYERAFLCALPRRLWSEYPTRMADLIKPGGYLAGYFFIDPGALRGPPFGIDRAELMELLSPRFSLLEEHLTDDAIGPFAGREYWMVWRRNP